MTEVRFIMPPPGGWGHSRGANGNGHGNGHANGNGNGNGHANGNGSGALGHGARPSGGEGSPEAAAHLDSSAPPRFIGLDVGSTTVKAVVVDAATDEVLWQDYQRHETKQPEKVLEMLRSIEADLGLRPGPHVRMFATGSGASGLCRYLGAKFVQEVTAVSLAVEKLYPELTFQTGQHPRERGLSQVQLLGGRAHPFQFGEGDEPVQLLTHPIDLPPGSSRNASAA